MTRHLAVWWGTNRAGGPVYSGRVHVIQSDGPAIALCGLPVEDVWELRPPVPDRLCPECCIAALDISYPAFATDESPAEQTAEFPAVDAGDP